MNCFGVGYHARAVLFLGALPAISPCYLLLFTLLFLFLSRVFRYGCELQEESDTTI